MTKVLDLIQQNIERKQERNRLYAQRRLQDLEKHISEYGKKQISFLTDIPDLAEQAEFTISYSDIGKTFRLQYKFEDLTISLIIHEGYWNTPWQGVQNGYVHLNEKSFAFENKNEFNKILIREIDA